MRKSASGNFTADFGDTIMNGIVEWVPGAANDDRMKMSITNFDPSAFSPVAGETAAAAELVGTMAVSIDVGFRRRDPQADGGRLPHRHDGHGSEGGGPVLPGRHIHCRGALGPGGRPVYDGGNAGQRRDEYRLRAGRLPAGPRCPVWSDRQHADERPGISPSRRISVPPDTPFSSLTFSGWSAPLYGATGIDQLELKTADGGQIAATGRVDMIRKGAGFQMTIAGDGVSADDLKRVWPAFIAADSRAWFVNNVVGGRLKASSMRYNFPVGSIDPTVEGPAAAARVTVDRPGGRGREGQADGHDGADLDRRRDQAHHPRSKRHDLCEAARNSRRQRAGWPWPTRRW